MTRPPFDSTVAALALLTVACAGQPQLAARETPIPAGLDSAARTRWVAAEERACHGVFTRSFDEAAIRRTASADSVVPYRYVRILTGVRCTPR